MKTRHLKNLLAIAIAGLLTTTARSATTLSSDAALAALKEGNARYVAGKPAHPNQDAARRTAVAKGQNPFVTVLTCSDSRVPAELLFDQGIGDTFVVRVAGNVSDTDEVGTIEYGVGHLNTPLLVVMGHTSCGAVKAVLEGAEVHGSIPALVDNIAPAVANTKAANPSAGVASLLGEAVKANVWVSIDDLFKRSSEVRELVKTGKLKVLGAVYDLETGNVNWLGAHPEQARLLAYTGGAGHEAGATHGEADAHAAADTTPDHAAKEDSHAAAATAEHGAADTHAAAVTTGAATHGATTDTEPRNLRWILGTLASLIAVMGASWYFTSTVMTRWKVPQRIAAGFAMVLIVLTGVGFAGYEGLHSAVTGFTEYRADARHSVLAGRIQANFLEMRIAAKDYQANRKAEDTRQYEERRGKVLSFLDEARKEINEPERKQMVETIATQLNQHYTLFQQMSKVTGTAALAEVGKRMAPVGETIDHEVEKLKLEFIANQNHAGPIVNRDMKEAQVAIASVGCGALVLGIFLAWLISRSIVGPLRNIASALSAGAEQTAAASSQVASASTTLAEGASEQAASLEETSASLEEMTSMVKRNADSAQQAKEISTQTRAAADTGARDMEQMQHSMAAIKTSSDEIAKIVKNIDEIAFQTNILALNAAVEAARAGEAGAGFAVVADEVRNLAQRSANAAKETANKIEDAIAKTTQGVEVSGKVAESLKQIIEKARTVDDLVGEIASASKEQSQGIQQVNTAVTQMDKVTQSNAASAEESASASEELSSQAQAVKDSVETLQALVGGSTRSRGAVRHEVASHQPAPAKKRATSKPVTRSSAHSSGNGRQELATVASNGRNSTNLPMPEESEFKNF